ncbi:hypothetical protein BGX28_007048 [Mortierella sp. GBA30]|nr:hypothetical protein BGX28_007048 [Mortierella sp. GBA30]
MDSYPPELVIHLQPTLIVTGFEDASQHVTAQPDEGMPPSPPPPRPRTQTGTQQIVGLEEQKAALLQAMLSRNNVSYWDSTKGLAGSLFYVIPEQRNYILPPTRKFLQQTGQQHLLPPSLSPSSATSPLYPDGLITPLWIRRHREQIPSVFIAIVDLWDRESVLGNRGDGSNQRAFSDKGPLGVIDPMEREHDIVLAQELLERRKAAQDRGVKFAAVVILQRSHMEDPSIEDRLNFVRKSAGLDIKNSFYVLPPSTSQEISEFAVNLQRSQYEGSMNYYKEQVKRHKKKKSNLPATTASVRPNQQQNNGNSQQQQQPQQSQQQQGLSVQGWMMRYEFKMGMFSECKQDIDSAVKHYESAYGLLVDMFAVTSTITPGASGLQARTKRWAEAKVLADTLCLKICKFHLYLDAPSTALFHFRRHLIIFKAFSESWRMGDDSFEYWAWVGKQYRVFGDLLDISTKLGFKLPVPSPGSVVYGSFAGLGSGTTGFGIGPGGDAFLYGGNVGGGRGGGTHGPGAGVNPILVLQHAGFFYHQAANCSVQRRLRFEMAEEAMAPVPTATKPYPPTLQSLNAERAIDHLELTIELLTKSYEQFKRHKAGRMTLFLASEIAGTYYTAGKFEMALKFFERIGKTYRKEGWNLILTSILKWSIQCAKEIGSWENVVEYLIEMMSPDMPLTDPKRQSIFDELVSILYTEIHPANTVTHNPLVLSMTDINSFVSCQIQFQQKQAFVSSAGRFQVQLSTQGGQGALPRHLRISYVQVEFSDASLNHRFDDPRPYTRNDAPHDTSSEVRTKDRTGRSLEWFDCKDCTLEQDDTGSSDSEGVLKKIWKKTVHLDIRPFETKVLEGVIVPEKEQIIKVVKVTLGIVTEHWNVALEYPVSDPTQEHDHTISQQSAIPAQGEPARRQWLDVVESSGEEPPKLRFRNLDKGLRQTAAIQIVPRESKVEIKTLFKSPAYLDEYFPIKIKVRNGEVCPVVMEMDVELQPLDPSIESLDSIVLDPHVAAEAVAAGSFLPSQIQQGIRLSRSTKNDLISLEGDKEQAEIPVGEWAEQTVYVKAFEIPAPRTIVCKVRYEISLEQDPAKKSWTEKQHSFRVLFILPFDSEVDYVLQPAKIPESVVSAASDEDRQKTASSGLVPILEPNQMDEKHGAVLIPALTHEEVYLMSTRVSNEGPWPVQVKEVKLIIGSATDALLRHLTAAATAVATDHSIVTGTGLSRNPSISRAKERRRQLQEAGVHVELIESSISNSPVYDEDLQAKERDHFIGDSSSGVQHWRSGNLQTFNHFVRVSAVDLELAPEQIEVGFLRIQWRRSDDDGACDMPYTVTNVPLQPLTTPAAEVYLTVDLPKSAQVNKPFTVKYEIHNPTGKLQELAMTVEPSEAMVYSGTMQATIRVLPYSNHALQMSCYPLSAGLVRVPRIRLVNKRKKPLSRRGKPVSLQQLQATGQQDELPIKIRGAVKFSGPHQVLRSTSSSASGSGGEAIVIFVKPEAGSME